MFKKGFTLAEVLITLGIIGVVAALTTPALVQNIGTSKIGPSLAKAVSTFENANQTMLAQSEAGSITSLSQYVSSNYIGHGHNGSPQYSHETRWSPSTYVSALSGHLKINPDAARSVPSYTGYNGGHYYPVRGTWSHHAYSLDNGSMYYYIIPHHGFKIRPYGNYPNNASNQLIGDVYIDINGSAKPNKQAKDIFRFYLYNDGTLRPYGSQSFDRTRGHYHQEYWNGGHACNSVAVSSPDTCAGSIFENNQKVIYE